jgi:hypothetical protein
MFEAEPEFWRRVTLWVGCVVAITLMLVLIYW